MVEFEESGGLLDGILAVAHPELYAAAQDLMTKLSTVHAPSTFLMHTWPSSFTSIQVIANRQTPLHRDMSSKPGWLDLLLSLGNYGQDVILEVRSLGISLLYRSGSIVPLSSKLLLHGIPRVHLDRVCYALYLNKAVFESLKILLPGMATIGFPGLPLARPSTQRAHGGSDRGAGSSRGGEQSAGHGGTAEDGNEKHVSTGERKGKQGGDIDEEDGNDTDGYSGGDGEGSGSDGGDSGGIGDAEGSSSGDAVRSTGTDEEEMTDVEMVENHSAA